MTKPLIIFEIANNHGGDLNHGKNIINQFSDIADGFADVFRFAFKFQFRDLDTFIHPAFRDRTDHKYVKRFTETRLTQSEFGELKDLVFNRGYLSICTAFDEPSVDLVQSMRFDYLKVASCSATDWPLLNKIADSTDLPIIASTAGLPLDELDKVVSFFVHRKRDLCLLHCVGEYPTELGRSEINQIDVLRQRYPDIKIGWSTHEDPSQMLTSAMVIAKNVDVIEKHVGIETDKHKLNAYSIDPDRTRFWLASCKMALEVCGTKGKRHDMNEKELKDLRQFKRGVFVSRDIKAGQTISRKDVFFAWPVEHDGLTANEMSKYVEITADSDIPMNGPINKSSVRITDTREKVWTIVQTVKKFLGRSGVVFPGNVVMEISHHYGIDEFARTGITMLTIVNREYCKKLIVVLPGQSHPDQVHRIKEETFMILYGELEAVIGNESRSMFIGDVVTIPPGTVHGFKSQSGCVIEELSTTHMANDSTYLDPKINENKQRKTIVNYWL
jgi:sialic acid synthase SpsE/quercetin dioxygenase-like cupin family protein